MRVGANLWTWFVDSFWKGCGHIVSNWDIWYLDPLFIPFSANINIVYVYQWLGIRSNIPTFLSFVKQLFYVDQNKCGHFNSWNLFSLLCLGILVKFHWENWCSKYINWFWFTVNNVHKILTDKACSTCLCCVYGSLFILSYKNSTQPLLKPGWCQVVVQWSTNIWLCVQRSANIWARVSRVYSFVQLGPTRCVGANIFCL